MCCWDDIDKSNFVAYSSQNSDGILIPVRISLLKSLQLLFFSFEDANWLASGFCEACVNILIQTQWDLYVNSLAKTTCKAEQRRLLARLCSL